MDKNFDFFFHFGRCVAHIGFDPFSFALFGLGMFGVGLSGISLFACGPEQNQSVETLRPGESSSIVHTEDSSGNSTSTDVSMDVEVHYPSTDLELEGTLRIPKDVNESSKVPGILLIHGSGPNSRDQKVSGQLNMVFGFEIAMFSEIARGLSEYGFAVLRYDKRSCGKFNGLCENDYPKPNQDLRIDAFIEDAEAGVRYLGSHPNIDENRIFVIGHSQGATFVPSLMSRTDQVRAGIMIAGNHSPIDEIIKWQVDFSKHMMMETGLSGEQIETHPVIQKLTVVIDQLIQLRAGMHDGSPIGGAPVVFWQSYFDQNERAIREAAALSRPLLVMRGMYDWNIRHEEWLAWKHTLGLDLPQEELPSLHQSVELPNITHALNRVIQEDWKKIKPTDIGSTVDASVTETIVAFCNLHR